MSKIRVERINDELRMRLSDIIQKLEDPRLKNSMISVVNVDTASDLGYAKVFISILSNDETEQQINSVMNALKNASSFIRHELAQDIKLRIVPKLSFIYDQTIQYSLQMDKVIKNHNKS